MEYKEQHNSTTHPSTNTQPSNTPSTYSTTPPKKEAGFLGEILWFAFVAFIIVLPIRFFVAQPFIVSGASMENTFRTGQYLIVDQLSYHFHPPQRGDVIVFRYPRDPSKFFIKRVIGLPGETITIDGSTVEIFNNENPDGVKLEEPYVKKMTTTSTMTEKLGKDEYFVMGDNRDESSDSRMWGVLRRDKIVGRTFLRLYPFTKVGLDPGDTSVKLDPLTS
jgi:signal peptidase I